MESFKKQLLTLARQRISDKNMTISQLAHKLDENESTIAKWLYDDRFPHPPRAKKLLDELGFSRDDFKLFNDITFGEKLFLMRNLEGLSTKEVADELNTSHYLVGKWETGARAMTNLQVRKMLDFFQITAEEAGVEVDEETFGERLSGEMQSKGLKQKDLAKMMYMSPVKVSRFAKNQSVPNKDELKLMADALELTVDDLIRGEDGIPYICFPLDRWHNQEKEKCY